MPCLRIRGDIYGLQLLIGLYRYDEYSFKTFRKLRAENNTLLGNFVLKLTEDRDGKIWIGVLKGGISCYDPATGVFRN